MGKIKKMLGKVFGKKKGVVGAGLQGSRAITGIDPGDAGSNTGGTYSTRNRRPGRRGADTPLGARSQRL